MNEEVEQQIVHLVQLEPEAIPVITPAVIPDINFPQQFPNDLLMEDANLALMDDDEL